MTFRELIVFAVESEKLQYTLAQDILKRILNILSHDMVKELQPPDDRESE